MYKLFPLLFLFSPDTSIAREVTLNLGLGLRPITEVEVVDFEYNGQDLSDDANEYLDQKMGDRKPPFPYVTGNVLIDQPLENSNHTLEWVVDFGYFSTLNQDVGANQEVKVSKTDYFDRTKLEVDWTAQLKNYSFFGGGFAYTPIIIGRRRRLRTSVVYTLGLSHIHATVDTRTLEKGKDSMPMPTRTLSLLSGTNVYNHLRARESLRLGRFYIALEGGFRFENLDLEVRTDVQFLALQGTVMKRMKISSSGPSVGLFFGVVL
jgi:hypothetical protein